LWAIVVVQVKNALVEVFFAGLFYGLIVLRIFVAIVLIWCECVFILEISEQKSEISRIIVRET